MSLSSELSIQGNLVQTLYSDYVEKKFIVNRKYQRKLVWTIDEKRNFIDTIISGLPIPLFLIAEKKSEDSIKYEIIDGMQRLDSIFSFIEQKYSLKDGFFNLSVMAETLKQEKSGALVQRTPVLDESICMNIVKYLIPISKAASIADEEIEEAFRRINSNGRHLSRQELRQAGATGKFSDLIRELSSKIRGDYSKDNIALNEMAKLSITSKRLGYYGVSYYDMFWVKHGVISYENIRLSKDEELIAFIVADMILENKDNFTAAALDNYYGFDSNPYARVPVEKTKIENAIDRISQEKIQSQFEIVFSEIDTLFTTYNKIFKDLLYNTSSISDYSRAFHVMFMAFYKLIVKEGKIIVNYLDLIDELQGIGNDLINDDIIRNQLYKQSYQSRVVRSMIGRIQYCFSDKKINDPIHNDWTSEISKLLMQSQTEQNQYDFKIGIYNLSDGRFNNDLILKIVKTLSAMNNLGKNTTGYIVIGIADKEDDAKSHESVYTVTPVSKYNYWITGIEAEAKKYCGSLDSYLHKLKEEIKKAPVEPSGFIQNILTNLKSRLYFGKELLILSTTFHEEPVWFDGELYERQGSHLNLVPKSLRNIVYKRFN